MYSKDFSSPKVPFWGTITRALYMAYSTFLSSPREEEEPEE
jgi:hypothetical protein